MIRIGVLFPEHLNLNGDAANAEVLSKQLTWRGVPSQIIGIDKCVEALPKIDVLVVGHGSIAAWSDVASSWSRLSGALVELMRHGLPVLAVSSGFELLCRAQRGSLSGLEVFDLVPEDIQRVSKFEVAEFEGYEVLGYKNSEAKLPTICRSNRVIGTLLHGPVLSKNPELLESFLVSISEYVGLDIPAVKPEVATRLGDHTSKIWDLERELARE